MTHDQNEFILENLQILFIVLDRVSGTNPTQKFVLVKGKQASEATKVKVLDSSGFFKVTTAATEQTKLQQTVLPLDGGTLESVKYRRPRSGGKRRVGVATHAGLTEVQ